MRVRTATTLASALAVICTLAGSGRATVEQWGRFEVALSGPADPGYRYRAEGERAIPLPDKPYTSVRI